MFSDKFSCQLLVDHFPSGVASQFLMVRDHIRVQHACSQLCEALLKN